MGVWESAEFDQHEQVCSFWDEGTGLRAIVAIHSTALGPAAGGTRFKPYDSESEATDDALRLSRAMSYKSALAGLPIGGGKAVIIGDPRTLKTPALLHAYGRFIDRIGSVFATGEDVGMTVADMETINEVTPFVGGTSAGAGDPSIHTAAGIMHGLRAVIERAFGFSDFHDLNIAIQGLGAVGWGVATRLHKTGARLTVADVRQEQVDRAVAEFGAQVAAPDAIALIDADVFCPCALGGVITEAVAQQLTVKAVAGAANYPLATPEAGAILARRGILYAPDYVINAGGIISGLEVCNSLPGRPTVTFLPLEERLTGIYDRLRQIFERSEREHCRPDAMAERIARELIGR